MGQNTSNSVWKPCEDLQKTFDLCHCQQRVYNKVLRWNFVIDQILIFHHNLQINSVKILQCDFLDCFSYFVSHSWGIPMMKITGLSHLFKWENLHNWWLTKYFFAPLYIWVCLWIFLPLAIFCNIVLLGHHHLWSQCQTVSAQMLKSFIAQISQRNIPELLQNFNGNWWLLESRGNTVWQFNLWSY